MPRFNCVGIGPGLGREELVHDTVKQVALQMGWVWLLMTSSTANSTESDEAWLPWQEMSFLMIILAWTRPRNKGGACCARKRAGPQLRL